MTYHPHDDLPDDPVFPSLPGHDLDVQGTPGTRWEPGSVDAIEQIVTAIGSIQQSEHVEQGRFSRAGWPHDGDILSGLNGQLEP